MRPPPGLDGGLGSKCRHGFVTMVLVTVSLDQGATLSGKLVEKFKDFPQGVSGTLGWLGGIPVSI